MMLGIVVVLMPFLLKLEKTIQCHLIEVLQQGQEWHLDLEQPWELLQVEILSKVIV